MDTPVSLQFLGFHKWLREINCINMIHKRKILFSCQIFFKYSQPPSTALHDASVVVSQVICSSARRMYVGPFVPIEDGGGGGEWFPVQATLIIITTIKIITIIILSVSTGVSYTSSIPTYLYVTTYIMIFTSGAFSCCESGQKTERSLLRRAYVYLTLFFIFCNINVKFMTATPLFKMY